MPEVVITKTEETTRSKSLKISKEDFEELQRLEKERAGVLGRVSRSLLLIPFAFGITVAFLNTGGKNILILWLMTCIATLSAYISISPFWKNSLNHSIDFILRKYGWKEGEAWELVSDETIEQLERDQDAPYTPAKA